jgi:hypothetical protein
MGDSVPVASFKDRALLSKKGLLFGKTVLE